MRNLVPILVCAASLGCSQPSRPADPPAAPAASAAQVPTAPAPAQPEPPPPVTHGYLRKGTRLFASPALAGDSLELGVLRPGEPIWQEAAFGAVKVLGRREGALHVETLTAVESSCASDRSLSGPFRLRGYVRPDALEAARPTPCPAPDSAPTLSELQTIGISHADPCDPDPRRQLGTSDIQLAAGAALTWPDGSDAGASTEITTFRCRRAHAKDDGARLCHALGGIGESPVLCFARAQADVLIRR